jgi:hypothetical protein
MVRKRGFNTEKNREDDEITEKNKMALRAVYARAPNPRWWLRRWVEQRAKR